MILSNQTMILIECTALNVLLYQKNIAPSMKVLLVIAWVKKKNKIMSGVILTASKASIYEL